MLETDYRSMSIASKATSILLQQKPELDLRQLLVK